MCFSSNLQHSEESEDSDDSKEIEGSEAEEAEEAEKEEEGIDDEEDHDDDEEISDSEGRSSTVGKDVDDSAFCGVCDGDDDVDMLSPDRKRKNIADVAPQNEILVNQLMDILQKGYGVEKTFDEVLEWSGKISSLGASFQPATKGFKEREHEELQEKNGRM